VNGRAELVEKVPPCLRVRTQCELFGVSRSTLDYEVVCERAEDLRIKRIMDEIYLRDPCLGTRKIVIVLKRDHGLVVNRKRVRRLREEMGLWTNGAQLRLKTGRLLGRFTLLAMNRAGLN